MTAAEFARAIGMAGESIQLIRDDKTLTFDGSLQPRGDSDASGPAGYGRDKRAVLYAGANKVTAELLPGDLLRCKAGEYQLVSVEDYTLMGEVVYRKAELAAIQRG